MKCTAAQNDQDILLVIFCVKMLCVIMMFYHVMLLC